ncbi:MAG: hypothetical protein WBA22_06080 [Candidatus Methanofastidiosia archaeon]
MVDKSSNWGKKWKILMAIILFSTIMTVYFLQKEDTMVQHQEDYFRGELIAIGEPALDSVVELVLTLNPPVDSLDTKVNFILPEGIELVEGDLPWKGDILRDQTVEVRIKVKPVREGQWVLESYVEGLLGGKYLKNFSYFLVFLTSRYSGKVSKTRFYDDIPIEGTAINRVVGLHLESETYLKPDEEAVMTFSLLASEDVSGVKVVIILPKEFIHISGPLEWSGDLKKEQKETFQLTIKTTEKGLFEIVGVVTYSGEKFESGYYIYVF